MRITRDYSTQNFKALNYSKVYADGLTLVKKELPTLNELGKKYDIRLSTIVEPAYGTEYIEVYVNHLNKKPSLLRRLFAPNSFSAGYADCKVDCESITDAVKEAISALQ